jgi:hypothetical protein
MTRGQVSASILLVLVGLWLLLQTVVGDLPGRLLSWRGYTAPNAGPSTPSSSGLSGIDGSGSAGAGPGGGGGSW